MAYIGRGTENISNVEVLDNLTFDGSASYTLQKSSVNFVPSSANNLLISISGVVQQGNFSVSGSTITFDTTVASSDTCDWILHYGTGLITTVADGAITEAKLVSNAVTTAKINNGAITSAKLDSGLALGKIGQVVQASTTTQTQVQTTSFGDTTLTGSITPTSTSSKIIVDVRGFYMIDASVSSSGRNANHRLIRTISGSDTTLQTDEHTLTMASSGATNIGYIFQIGYEFLDSPSTTSECTYKIQISVDNTNYRANFPHDGNKATMTLMEVLA